jgi:hypothetical protein
LRSPSLPSSAPSPSVAAPSLAAPSPAAPSADGERARTVRLRVSGPTGARVWLDGRAAGVLPLDLTLSAREQKRVVMVQRPGAARWVKTIAGGEDVSLAIFAPHKATLDKQRDSRETRKKGLFDPFER